MEKFLTLNPKEISTHKLHSYLLSAVAPRPIALSSTMDDNMNPNLSPFSFFNVFSANPPIMIFSPARRVKNNTTKDTLDNVLSTKEVVINIVSYEIVEQMSLSSSEYPSSINEFEKAGFTMLESDLIKPFRVKESPVQFECIVQDVVSLGEKGGAGNLVICEIVKIHINKKILNDDLSINPHKIDLVARAGGNFYTRAKKGFFEIPKPISNLGIGFDNLPKKILNSSILSGNDLAKLANVESLPTKDELENFKEDNISIKGKNSHELAKILLQKNDIYKAWKVLLYKD